MFKKTLFFLWFLWFISVGNLAIVNADTVIGFGLNNENVSEFNTLWTIDTEEDELIDVIKNFINWVLGILSLIALVIILYAWFKMVTANWDETKYKDGFKIIQQAAVWLAIIGLSWFIVSMIFWLIQWSTATNN
jgi:hypothetical protein